MCSLLSSDDFFDKSIVASTGMLLYLYHLYDFVETEVSKFSFSRV